MAFNRKKHRRYADYDYEETYDMTASSLDEDRIREMLADGRMTSVYATKTIRSGNQLEIEIYPEFTKKQMNKMKAKKKNSSAQKKLNDKNSRKRLERLINANFTSNDYWITLTYADEHLPRTMDDAMKDMKNFIRKINYRRKKLGMNNAKYIYITEFSKEKGIRCHHHLILEGGMTMDEIESRWTKGRRNNIRKLDPDENGLTGVAAYLSKDPKGKKRWKSSKNLKKPKESKSYTIFPFPKIRKMIINNNLIEEMMTRRYKNRIFTRCEVRYNEFNSKFYIYARMRYDE